MKFLSLIFLTLCITSCGGLPKRSDMCKYYGNCDNPKESAQCSLWGNCGGEKPKDSAQCSVWGNCGDEKKSDNGCTIYGCPDKKTSGGLGW